MIVQGIDRFDNNSSVAVEEKNWNGRPSDIRGNTTRILRRHSQSLPSIGGMSAMSLVTIKLTIR